ncbi:MAG: 4Fe-4S binding protein [Desulfomonile tiedjei]|uniref:4Fe-4S binding protein n=1 Tax=Desulfomonile tiedjei TaxID=2358 RepID=A0A9D6V1V9_9BACT|nr:4Fe-4S binding protein [Desulfomonile tiedjei]
MNFSSLKLAYFSPTGTTKKVLEAIAEGIGIEPVEHLSVTSTNTAMKPLGNFTDELVVIGAPVYAGRLPEDAVKRFKHFRAQGTRAILVVVYGNRDYEDSLLELTDLSRELGFIPVASAAFIGEHSFSTKDVPIATGRPDKKDLEKAVAFGLTIKQRISDLGSLDTTVSLKVPGNFPYKTRMPPIEGAARTLASVCTTCGTCAEVCPKGAIKVNTTVETDPNLCIKCCACVKECPTQARIMDIPFVRKIAAWLNENYTHRKEPELFP